MSIHDLRILKYNRLAVIGAHKLDGTESKTDKLSKMPWSSTYPVLHMHLRSFLKDWWATSEISWSLSRICTGHEMWKAIRPDIFQDSCKEKTALLKTQHQCLLRFVHLQEWLMLQKQMLNWHNRTNTHGSSAKLNMLWKILEFAWSSWSNGESWSMVTRMFIMIFRFGCTFNKFPVVDFMTELALKPWPCSNSERRWVLKAPLKAIWGRMLH